MSQYKIAIVTTGRFHVLDLARELSLLGHEVVFWGIVPRRQALKYCQSPVSFRNLLPWVLPLVVLQRWGRGALREWAKQKILLAIDKLVAHGLEPCDIFIGMSGLAVESACAAKSRYGAKVFLERGSRHIKSQQQILAHLARRGLSASQVSNFIMEREVRGYAEADRIVVPSEHAKKSFLEEGFAEDRIFKNNYGVDLEMFQPTMAPRNVSATILYVGAWSYQKGVDILVSAWQNLENVELLHVGSVKDAPLPEYPGFKHVDSVPQWRLTEFYSRAHLFVQPSRQEGLSLVLIQAVASGLPVVCTNRTGGEDLKAIVDDPARIEVVQSDNVGELEAAIRKMLPTALSLRGKRDLLGGSREYLTWSAYGRRYADELERVMTEDCVNS